MCTYRNRLPDKQANGLLEKFLTFYVRAYSFSIRRQKNVGNKFGILRFKAESLTQKVRLINWTWKAFSKLVFSIRTCTIQGKKVDTLQKP